MVFFSYFWKCAEDAPVIEIIVKVFGNEKICLPNQHVGSLEEIQDLIKNIGVLKPLITENTILLGDDGKVLSSQHIESARESGSLSIILFKPVIKDTEFETHGLALEKAFDLQFQDPHGMKEDFRIYLNRKHKTWKSNNHYIPYSTIFQSSGYGKSRLIKEMAKDIPTIYICLRDAKSTGYPLRTNVGADLFERVLGNLKEGEEWRFLYVLQHAIQYFQEELEEIKSSCNSNINEELWNRQMNTGFCNKVWTEIQKRSEDWQNIDYSDVNSSVDFITKENSNDDVCFLLCIDEARVLISPTNRCNITPFRLFRRALRKIQWNGFFALLLDTLSRISNFAPPKLIDPSGRDTTDLSFELFYPYFRLTTMDIFVDSNNNYDDEYRNLAKYGRPLYMSYLQSCADDPQAVDKLNNLLRRKLLGGADNFIESRQEISSLAILSLVVGFDMSPQSQLASELVASHMATCFSVSEDRERLIIAYPSEPLLSEIALEFMSSLMLPKILKHFNTLLKKGLVEPGPRGELVARIILAVVAHKLRRNRPENTVRKFLEELYNHNSLPEINEYEEFMEGTIAYTHFTAIDYVPTKKSLHQFYTRRSAFIMKRNQPGADICIPVKLENSEYSLIVIQVKNINSSSIRADKDYPASAKSKLNSDYVFKKSDLKDHNGKHLCLYWQLGFHGHDQKVPNHISTRQNPEPKNLYWATFGRDHFNIGDEIIDILTDLLTSYISPFDSEWQVHDEEKGDIWSKDKIKIMHPLRYGNYE